MKKKIVCILLACVLCVTALGGCQGQKEPWSLEDFSVYDENGNMIKELPSEETLKDGAYTKRGLHRGDSVSKIIELYPLEYSLYTPSDAYTYDKWKGKYKDGADLVNQAKEDEESAYVITLSFIKDGDNLIPLEIDEVGKRKYIGEMTYEIVFAISRCQVNFVKVSSKVK